MFENFSSTLFETISEGEKVAKARYKLVCPDWVGGDVGNIFEPLASVESGEVVERLLEGVGKQRGEGYVARYEIEKRRRDVEYNELVLLYTSKIFVRCRKGIPREDQEAGAMDHQPQADPHLAESPGGRTPTVDPAPPTVNHDPGPIQSPLIHPCPADPTTHTFLPAPNVPPIAQLPDRPTQLREISSGLAPPAHATRLTPSVPPNVDAVPSPLLRLPADARLLPTVHVRRTTQHATKAHPTAIIRVPHDDAAAGVPQTAATAAAEGRCEAYQLAAAAGAETYSEYWEGG